MPFNPLDMLKRLGSAAVTPMVDEETIEPYQDMLDSPSLDRSPMEASLRGFGAGAMEGLRGMTSPLALGSMAMGGAGTALRGLGRAGQAMGRSAPSLDLVQPQAIRQIAPQMDDVNALIGDMQRNMARIPSRRPPMPAQAQGNAFGRQAPSAEFVPRGGEAGFNAARPAPTPPSPYDQYLNMQPKLGGRGR